MTEQVTRDTFSSIQVIGLTFSSVTTAHGHANKDLDKDFPIRVPHLMHFHIQHTGPAPVSTYFRIRPHFGFCVPNISPLGIMKGVL